MKKQLILIGITFLNLQIKSQITNIFPNDGNTGLGFTTPYYKLDIIGLTAADGIRVRQWGNNSSALHLHHWNASSTTGHNWSIYSLGPGDGWAGQGSLAFQDITGHPGLPRMIIDKFGKVGIGCANPGANLHVGDGTGSLHYPGAQGVLVKYLSTSSDRALMELHNPSGSNRLIIESLNDAAYVASFDSKPLSLQYFGGNVGIGTNAPSDRLQIGNDYTRFTVGQANSAQLGNGTSYIGFNAARSPVSNMWSTNGDPINNGGVILYGDIQGNLLFSTIQNNTGGYWSNITDAKVREEVKMQLMGNGNLILQNQAPNGTDDAFVINDATTYPSTVTNFKVKRNGTVYAREIFVQLGVFPDYVFSKDYKLMSLDELAMYISSNHHLPNVPSAKEIETNGIGTGELNKIQMEKIEELTLYILELKKEIDSLKSQIKSSKK